MLKFLACHAVEGNHIRPIARQATKSLADGIIADITELLGELSLIAKARIPKIPLKLQPESSCYHMFEICQNRFQYVRTTRRPTTINWHADKQMQVIRHNEEQGHLPFPDFNIMAYCREQVLSHGGEGSRRPTTLPVGNAPRHMIFGTDRDEVP